MRVKNNAKIRNTILLEKILRKCLVYKQAKLHSPRDDMFSSYSRRLEYAFGQQAKTTVNLVLISSIIKFIMTRLMRLDCFSH